MVSCISLECILCIKIGMQQKSLFNFPIGNIERTKRSLVEKFVKVKMTYSKLIHSKKLGGGNPFQNIDKTSVLQETRTFNETPVNARKCTHILTKILYLINQVCENSIFPHFARFMSRNKQKNRFFFHFFKM